MHRINADISGVISRARSNRGLFHFTFPLVCQGDRTQELVCRAEQEQFQASSDLTQHPQPQAHGMHVMSVLEQIGDDVMRDNFWNYGQCRCWLGFFAYLLLIYRLRRNAQRDLWIFRDHVII